LNKFEEIKKNYIAYMHFLAAKYDKLNNSNIKANKILNLIIGFIIGLICFNLK